MKIKTLLVAACAAASLGASRAQAQQAPAAAEGPGITVAVSGGPVPGIMAVIASMFEQASGKKVTLVTRGGQALADDVKQGNVDLVVADAATVNGLAQSGDIAAASATPVMTSKIGLGVRTGSPHPDISSADKLKATLLGAKNVGYSRFASGQIFLRAVERLGITDAVTGKAVIPQGGPVGALVVRGEAEIGVQQVAELVAVPGVDLVGPLPDELQEFLPTSAGIPTRAKDAETARALIAYLRSAPAIAVLTDMGMDVP
jgi:molybdate transport system substrate-binding protein